MASKLTNGSQQVFCLGTCYQMCSGLEAFHQKRIEAEENVGNTIYSWRKWKLHTNCCIDKIKRQRTQAEVRHTVWGQGPSSYVRPMQD